MVKKIYNLSFWLFMIFGIPCMIVVNSEIYRYTSIGIFIIIFWCTNGFINLICEVIIKKKGDRK